MDKVLGAVSGKHTINLLRPELIPTKPLWTLARVVGLWVLVLVMMLAWGGVGLVQVATLTTQQKQLSAENSLLTTKQTSLEQQISQHKANAALVARLATLKSVLANKKQLLGQLTDPSLASVSGFASAMTELSAMHHQDISLQTVSIHNDDMTFAGVARAPESVPAWLAGFEQSVLLSGKAFVNFTLQENEQQLIEFVVSSKAANAEEN